MTDEGKIRRCMEYVMELEKCDRSVVILVVLMNFKDLFGFMNLKDSVKFGVYSWKNLDNVKVLHDDASLNSKQANSCHYIGYIFLHYA